MKREATVTKWKVLRVKCIHMVTDPSFQLGLMKRGMNSASWRSRDVFSSARKYIWKLREYSQEVEVRDTALFLLLSSYWSYHADSYPTEKESYLVESANALHSHVKVRAERVSVNWNNSRQTFIHTARSTRAPPHRIYSSTKLTRRRAFIAANTRG